MLKRQLNQKSAGDICQYWYFLDKEFKFQPDVCNSCHDVIMMSINLSGVAVLNIYGADCCCVISAIRKIETINLT